MIIDLISADEKRNLESIRCCEGNIEEARSTGGEKNFSNEVKLAYAAIKKNYKKNVPDKFWDFSISFEVMVEIQLALSKSLEKEFSMEIEKKVKNFVGALFSMQLQHVPVNVVPGSEGRTVEAFIVKCGRDKHEVFMPQFSIAPEDLLSHEIGHAVHFTRIRINDEISYWATNPLLSEFVAYFTQFSYILSNGTRDDFLAALGALQIPYFGLLYIKLGKPNFEDFFNSPLLIDFKKIFTKEDLLGHYTYISSIDIASDIYAKMGILLALKCLGNVEAVKDVIAIDRIDVSPEEKLRAVFSDDFDEISDMSNIDDHVRRLIAIYFDEPIRNFELKSN